MRHLVAWLLAALGIAGASAALAQTTLVPDPPRFVAGPDVVDMSWSPGGRYLLAVSVESERWVFDRPPRSSASLVLWNQDKSEAKAVLRTQERVPEVHWLAGTNDAYVLIRAGEPDAPAELWRVDARTATVRRVEGIVGDIDVATSPTQPWAIVYGADEGGGYVRSLNAAGALGPRVPLGEPQALFSGWAADGAAAYFHHVFRPEDVPDPPRPDSAESPVPRSAPPASDRDPVVPAYPVFNPATGVLTTSDRMAPRYEARPPVHPFKVSTTTLQTAEGSRGKSPDSRPWAPPVHPLWLEQEGDPELKRLLLAADADAYVISPRGDAVAYRNGEGAFVVRLVAAPTAALKEARRRAVISQLLNNAKQAGLSAIMYAVDNDDMMPAPGADLGALIGPYLKDPAMLDESGGFHYTFGGGTLGGVENPAETVLGYYDGPGGRATTYLDGHVKWMPMPSE